METEPYILAEARTRSMPVEIRPRRLFAGVLALALLLVVGVSATGVVAARRLAETEAVADAADAVDLLADVIIEPALADGLPAGDPDALATLDAAVRDHVLGTAIVRVKVWDESGRILYSDEPRLIGRMFELDDDDLEGFDDPAVHADVSDLDEPENVYERDSGTLLEAYRPVTTPSGTTLLFECYFRYDDVLQRSGELWRSFAAITLGSIVLLVLLLLPVLTRLLTMLRRARTQREALLLRAIDASSDERRRIAATVHDGAVQDMTAASFAIHLRADRATADGDTELADELRSVAGTVRAGLGGLRSLLVDIYPPSLADSGLVASLDDLAITARARGVAVTIETDPATGTGAFATTGLDAEGERVVFRVAQEALANVVKHSGASAAIVRLSTVREQGRRRGGWLGRVGWLGRLGWLGRRGGDRAASRSVVRSVVLEVVDDGVGFDAEAALAHPDRSHLGIRILRDLAVDRGAGLQLRTHPGGGTSWRLEVGV